MIVDTIQYSISKIVERIPHYHLMESYLLYFISKVIKRDPQLLHPHKVTEKGKKKDIIFILGSGYSINSISKYDWEKMSEVGFFFSFNYFFKFRGHIDIDYHIMREVSSFKTIFNMTKVSEYCEELFDNPNYSNTIYFIHYDPKSHATISAVFFHNIFKNRQICFYRNLRDRLLIKSPSEDFYSIPHCGATLFDAINMSYLLGYKKIVLVGVDLYDRRYFFLRENETRESDTIRSATYKDSHNTTDIVLKAIPIWNEYLRSKGVNLYVYNPKSLLVGILPIYRLTKDDEK